MAKPAQVISFRRMGERPVAPVDIAVSASARATAPITSTPAADLAGNVPFVFLIGSGNTGKTTAARYIIERAHAAGRQAMLAAMDPINRSLTQYFDGVEQPQTSEPAESANFLRELLTFSMSGKHPSIVDTGAGDTSLGAVYAEMPDLEADLEQVGIAPVALYTLSERIDDLGPFLKLRFQPKATAFICNLGLTSGGPDAFRTSLEQPAVREAIEAGARVIYMPYLDRVVVKQIEVERMSFAGASKKLAGIQGMQVRAWLRAMDTAFEGVSSCCRDQGADRGSGMTPAEARSGLLTAIKRAELHDDPLAPVLAALGDALVSMEGLVTRAENASVVEPAAVSRIEQAAVASAAGASKGAVVEIQDAITALVKQIMEVKRPHLTEQDRAEFVQITSAASSMVMSQQKRSRTRLLALVFGGLALIATASAGFAGYSIRSDRCGLLEAWAATMSAASKR